MWPSNPACSAWRKRASRVARAKPPGSCCACGGATCPLIHYRAMPGNPCCRDTVFADTGAGAVRLPPWLFLALFGRSSIFGSCRSLCGILGPVMAWADKCRCWPSGPVFFFLLAANPPTTSRNPALVRHSLSSPLTETLLSPHPTIGRHLVFPLSTPRLSTAPRVVPVTRPLGAVYGDTTSGGSRLLTRATATGYKKAAVSQ